MQSRALRKARLRRIRRRRRKEIFLKRILPLAVFICLLIWIVLNVRSCLNLEAFLSDELTFCEGVQVNGADIGGMTIAEAKEKIMREHDSLQGISIRILYQGKTYPVQNLLSHDLDEVLEKAFALGRTGGREERKAEIKKLKKNPVNFEVAVRYDDAQIDELVEELARQVDVSPINADILSVDESGKLQFSEAADGYLLDQEDLKAQLKQALNQKDYQAKIQAKTELVHPEITKETAPTVYKIIGEFKTTATSNENRNQNIRLASEAIDKTIVKPGEEFSMNRQTGERTPEKGYKDAGIFLNGELVEEPGGGVCQVSTTLYNALIVAGLETTERFNHSYAVAYAKEGEDAMVSYSSADLKFRNNSKGSVAVVIEFHNQNLKALLYGIPVLEEGISLSMESEVTEVVPMGEPLYEESEKLRPGQTAVKQAGKDGHRVVTYLVTKKNGVEISREYLHTSNYRMKQPIILVGKEVEQTVPTEPSAPPVSEE